MNSMSLVMVFNEPEVKHFLRSSFFLAVLKSIPCILGPLQKFPEVPGRSQGRLGDSGALGRGVKFRFRDCEENVFSIPSNHWDDHSI